MTYVLSLGLVKSIVDVLEKLVLDLVNVLFGEKLREHHRGDLMREAFSSSICSS